VADTAAGYLNSERFLSFLDRAESGEADAEGDLGHILESRGLVVVVLLILLGGLALNLTPCVLPMIPVNLAIIGAGTGAQGPRGRGFALGAAYGLAMALTYGILGLLVVLTGAGFGAINSSPWFNLAIAVVFAVLALALFDVFTIDFSRFGGRADAAAGRMARGSFALALFMGTIAALLAGACVAPILISVLLLAASLYSAGNPIGLLLPFLLGLGMALPWPFAGAGISFLPKPGQWMVWVKKLFALLVAAMALYYATLGIRMLGRSGVQTAAGSGSGEGTPGDWHTAPAPALTEALTDGKPVFIDFWATYCKNCHAMDRTTFRDEDVVKRLGEYVLLKYQAEDPSDPETAAFIEQFGVIGLPTYVLLLPEP
jgi:thiol:disulfide interchange protein